MNHTVNEKGDKKCCHKGDTQQKKYSKELTEFLYAEYEAQGVRFGS